MGAIPEGHRRTPRRIRGGRARHSADASATGSAKASPARPLWRRPISVGAAALVLLVAGSVSVYLSMHSEPALAFKSATGWSSATSSISMPIRVSMRRWARPSASGSRNRASSTSSPISRCGRRWRACSATRRLDRSRGGLGDCIAGAGARGDRAFDRSVRIQAAFGRRVDRPRWRAHRIDPHRGCRWTQRHPAGDGPATSARPKSSRRIAAARSSRRRNRWRESRRPTSRPCALRARAGLGAGGRLDQSARLFKYATELDPGFAMAYGRLGAALLTVERYAEARLALENALTSRGD